jgi:hypothetical protein
LILKPSPDGDAKAAEIKKDILNGIVMKAISDHLSYISKDVDDYNSLLDNTRFTIDSKLNEAIERELYRIIDLSVDYSDNVVVEEEAMDVFASILSISKPSSEFIDKKIKYLKLNLAAHKKFIAKGANDVKRKDRYERKLLSLYEKYKVKNEQMLTSPSYS